MKKILDKKSEKIKKQSSIWGNEIFSLGFDNKIYENRVECIKASDYRNKL